MAADEAKPFARDQAIYVSPDARDRTGTRLFNSTGKYVYAYGFEYSPPFYFVEELEDGDLLIRDDDGELIEVSPECVSPESADWEPELLGDLKAPLHEPDVVNHPSHYQSATGLEAIEVIEAFALGYGLGNATKYVLRAGKKGTAKDAITDLEKAVFYIEREIEKRMEALR